MKRILIVVLLSAASWAQNGGVIPPPDIAHMGGEIANAGNRAAAQAADTALIRQQTQLLKQQTEALKQQNALLKQQQEQAAALAAQPAKTFIASAAIRKPKIDDIDAASGHPRFATYADYEDAKDEWLIEEAVRRFEALHPASPPPTH